MGKQKRFQVTRKDGSHYFVDEKDQVIEQPWDDQYYTAGTRMQESAPPTPVTRSNAATEHTADLAKLRKETAIAYQALGLTEAEAKLAAELDLTDAEPHGLGLRF
jgi:hypothetical protein